MEKRGFGNGLKSVLHGASESLQGAADSLKASVKDAKIPEIKMPEIKIPDVKIPDIKQSGFFRKKENDDGSDSETIEIKSIPVHNAMKIIYYLMAVDGQVFHDEEEKFNAIGAEFDPEFAKHKEKIVEECQNQLDKVIDTEDYYDVLQDGVEDALLNSMKQTTSVITPKLLIWDLLAVAYSDNHYGNEERKLIKYIVRKLDIDKAVFLELESSILTLMDLEKELTWIKTTDRPYLTIEMTVNELADRKAVIFESVKDLITL